MTWSQEISQLITDVDQLTSAANVKKSVFDASIASAEADKNSAIASASAAAASAATSLTRAQESDTHRNTALAVYGTTATQQSSVISTQASAALTSGYAASASAALQQDLSGITAALHRSPNPITSMFVYDTSKDSDGGAWTEKGQNTSWYNETVHGKWLGPNISENFARHSNATLGSELITNGNFSNGSTGWTLSGFAIVDGVAVSNSASGIFIRQNVTTIAGKLYRVEYSAKLSASLVGSIVRLNSLSNGGTTNVTGPTNSFGTIVEYVVAGSATTGLEIITTAGSNIFSVDNVSLREVTAINTTSGDYFQLSTDGKFYRLWKNLLKFSDQVENAIWSRRGVTVTSNAVSGPLSGTFGDSIYVATNFATPRDIRQSVNMVAGVTYCYSAYIKAGTQNLIAISSGNFNNFGATINLSTQVFSSVTANTTTQVVSVGDGWYRVSISFTANTTVLSEISIAMAGQDADADPTDFINVYGAQLEYGSTPTTYEVKTVDGATTEIFRGNKRDFPRLAGIIAEASNVTIYDLTEPGRPMWSTYRAIRDFTNTSGRDAWGIQSNLSSVSVINGNICVGNNGNNPTPYYGPGLWQFNFPSDTITQTVSGGYQSRRWDGVALFNSAVAGSTVPTQPVFFNSAINAITMTILPDAPIDIVTGLKIPTIAVATNAGISVIKHNGTIVNSASTGSFSSVALSTSFLSAGRGDFDWYYTLNPGNLGPAFALISKSYNLAPDFGRSNTTRIINSGIRGDILRVPTGSIVQRLRNNETTVARGLASTITNTYNTGWMPGDIRRAYMSDIDVGFAGSSTQIVTNSEFTDGVAGWTVTNPSSVSITVNAGIVSFDQIANPLATIHQAITVIPGRRYTINARTGSVGGNYFHTISVGNTTTSTEYYTRRTALGMTIHGGDFTPTQSTIYVSMLTGSGLNDLAYLDYIRIYETTVKDRSYKAAECYTNGTLIKSQLASGTSLVGYSGFSTANYLQEPYSADLDFGTSELSASAWINTAGVVRRNLMIWTESFEQIVWSKINTNITVNATIAPDGTNTADALVPTGTGFSVNQAYNIVGTYTASISVKDNGVGSCAVAMGTTTIGYLININLNTGTFISGRSYGGATLVNYTIADQANGWWKVSITATASVGGVTVFNADGTTPAQGIYVWGAQLELGTVATAYQRVFATYDPNDAVDVKLGNELVTNGDFSNGTTGWSGSSGATLAVVSGELEVTGYGASYPTALQVVPVVVGKTYLVSAIARKGTATTTNIYVSPAVATDLNTSSTTNIFLQRAYTATTATLSLVAGLAGAGSGTSYFDNISVREIKSFGIIDRSYTSGAVIRLGMMPTGTLIAEASDGTTSRVAVTTAVYNTSQWLKAEAIYTTDGSLGVRVNGRDVAVSRGTPLLSLTTGKNLLLFSESFDNAIWAKSNTTISANASIAPDGTTTADRLVETTATNFHGVNAPVDIAGQTRTFSVYLKEAERRYAVVTYGGNITTTVGGGIFVDLRDGAVLQTAGAKLLSHSVTGVGNGWYRCSVSVNMSGVGEAPAPFVFIVDNSTHSIGTAYGSKSYTGVSTSGILIWGAQLETGSVLTSYGATNVAPLSIGNNFTADAPFPGSIALLKLSATVPTTEQSIFMYEQEKQLFRANAASVLPDANAIIDMSYDDTTDRWAAISTTNKSYWNGLVRTSVTPVPSGLFSKIATTSGIELAARINTNQGVDITIPAYVLREELVKRSEQANKLSRQIAIYDYIGGFTGNITTGSTAITTVTNLTYLVSPVGARISGTGIPTNATIVAVSGTTIYISAAATATTSALTISFLDFNLPVGFETESITTAGVVRQEGTTKDYTRLFNGFLETIRFAVAPGATTWVRIQASKSS